MRSRTGRRALRARGLGVCGRSLGVIAGLTLAFAAAGCTTSGQPTPDLATGRGAAIAFEKIDGPPVAVFQKLVADLAAEAEARQVPVVSHDGPASYRIRGYLAAIVERGRTHIGWVWDVYDADRRRVLRIAGEEPGGRRAAKAWAAADDEVLRRIARASMERLVAFLAAPAAPVAPAGPEPAPAAVAAAEAMADSSPALALASRP